MLRNSASYLWSCIQIERPYSSKVPALTVHRPPKQGMQGNGVQLTPVCRSSDAQLLAERLQPELHAAAHSAMERGGPFSPPDPPYRYPAARHPALLIYCYTGFHN